MNGSERFDVVVCGYGGAGAAAATAAHDCGASVVIVEKSTEGGGSTAESGGSFATVNDESGAIEHYLAITEGRTPREVVSAYVHGVLQVPAWLAELGARTEALPMGHPAFPRRYAGTAYRGKPHADAIGPRVRVHEDGVTHGGTSLWNLLRCAVERRGIEVRLGTPATALLRGERGEPGEHGVSGVLTPAGRIHARRGIVLATGGFGYDAGMLREHLGVEIPAFGPPGRNTGDGIRMAREVGADLWHMGSIAAGFGYRTPGVEAAWMCVMPGFGFVMVDGTGQRFLNEPAVEHHAAGHALVVREFRSGEFRRLPSYLVFDERTRLAGPIATHEAGANRKLAWSKDNRDEIAKDWIRHAETVEGLAARLGLPAAALRDTVTAFNRAARDGGDPFGRITGEMLPIEQPPFYGIPVWPALFNTQGGPRRDAQARVVDVGGRPIPGLFSAGELGSIWASLYPGAGNVTESLVFGRIAGTNAARRHVP